MDEQATPEGAAAAKQRATEATATAKLKFEELLPLIARDITDSIDGIVAAAVSSQPAVTAERSDEELLLLHSRVAQVTSQVADRLEQEVNKLPAAQPLALPGIWSAEAHDHVAGAFTWYGTRPPGLPDSLADLARGIRDGVWPDALAQAGYTKRETTEIAVSEATLDACAAFLEATQSALAALEEHARLAQRLAEVEAAQRWRRVIG